MAGLPLLGLLACILPLASFYRLQSDPILVVSEICYYPNLNLSYVQEEVQRSGFLFELLDYKDTCEYHQKLPSVLSSTKSKLIIGSFPAKLCNPVRILSSYFNISLLTWNCPEEKTDSRVAGNSIQQMAAGFTRVVVEMNWKSVAIISSESGWWSTLAHSVDINLRSVGITAKFFISIEEGIFQEKLQNKLRILKSEKPCRAVIICFPPDREGIRIQESLRNLELSRDNTIYIFLDLLTLPSWRFYFQTKRSDLTFKDFTVTHKHYSRENFTTLYRKKYKNETEKEQNINVNKQSDLNESSNTVDLRNIVLYTENEALNLNLENYLIQKILNSFNSNKFKPPLVVTSLVDIQGNFTVRPLLNVILKNESDAYEIKTLKHNFEDWRKTHKELDECDWFCYLFSAWVYWAISGFFVLVFLILGMVVTVKYHLRKKRKSKAVYKVLLTASDFVFPQITDSRRVDEGIEAMLCCWLQQLQEFGGPEMEKVDKPDLIQNSGGPSGRTPIRNSSSPNLAKQIIADSRVRYNGDLVQMKPVPPNGNCGELKAKTVELLLLLHNLRHENLNPLIGCLAEPPKAALVSEYCSRGSLQDVLQQDDIKLDWSFRLSLLTDLVRGMKYLHSTQIKVHGYLTSRNCVIDARWVLKVTDYGLPTFYESQGLQPPTKTARDLLWTAPELLRYSNLRKKGTQPGDVYAFGIILQEVVVRGEPFCMLALSPEEIIEKVKRPPPLIRPSVSKGAAPPEAINIMRQCWAEQAELRPDFNIVHDQFKKLNHGRKVNFVDTMFQMLEKYSNNLEELIRERTEQLDIEKKKTEQLLIRMLPSYVAEKLKLGMPVDPEEFEEVTIYFSDIVGFTTISAHSTPFQVVDLLNDLYTCFDATINAFNVYKVETIGDAYMVVGGLPVRIPDHAEQIATMALDLLHESGKFCIRHLPGTPLRLRIGLHTGPCCAGVVGLTMPRYCLFGDTVNTASRMESTGSAWRIHMSEATKNRLERAGGYQIEYRGPTEIKGKGTMDTFWLLGKEGFNKALPVAPSIEESHGLDESLIISKIPTISQNHVKLDDSFTDSVSIGSSVRHMSFSEGHTKAPSPNPTFIKTMEFSKFATLNKAQDNSRSSDRITKSTSGDHPFILGTPVSASEVAAALLGASTSSLCGYKRCHRGTGSRILEEEEDLSKPYNHYRCLSPKQKGSKLLMRQFSLDRTEDIGKHDEFSPRLTKQNSAGAADLEKIEEISLKISLNSHASSSQFQCTLSVSADSLIPERQGF